jgi:hypothetical protein
MPTVPTRTDEFLTWAEQRAQTWQVQPTAIGLTTAQAVSMQSAVLLARGKFADRAKAQTAAEIATNEQNTAVRDARRVTSDLIRAIRGFAANSDDPNMILNMAELPLPSSGAPLPPPGKPNTVNVAITPTTGAITLSWKVVNPAGASGTSYIVRRRTGNTGEFVFVGVTGTKKFTDSSFVAGPDSVQYTIQGQRSDVAGLVSDIVTINFGRTGPGRAEFTVVGGTAVSEGEDAASETKLAA